MIFQYLTVLKKQMIERKDLNFICILLCTVLLFLIKSGKIKIFNDMPNDVPLPESPRKAEN